MRDTRENQVLQGGCAWQSPADSRGEKKEKNKVKWAQSDFS